MRRNKCHPPNSPNTAPATQNDHPTSGRNLRKTAETSFPMRGRSETVPRMIRSRSETVSVSPQPATQQRLLFALRTNGSHYHGIWEFHWCLVVSYSRSTSLTTLGQIRKFTHTSFLASSNWDSFEVFGFYR